MPLLFTGNVLPWADGPYIDGDSMPMLLVGSVVAVIAVLVVLAIIRLVRSTVKAAVSLCALALVALFASQSGLLPDVATITQGLQQTLLSIGLPGSLTFR